MREAGRTARGTAAVLACCWVLTACEPPQGKKADAGVPRGEGFDFYVLSLSWSPSYCAAEGAQGDERQCEAGRAHAFIVHGLWPQFERGYPEYCDTRAPDHLPGTLVSDMLDLTPSAGLIGHQWRKHGTCTGLSPQEYFKVTRAARERVTVPAEFRTADAPPTVDPVAVEAAFLSENSDLTAGGIAVTCDDYRLRDVRICLTRQLQFRECPEVDERACAEGRVRMPPVGGG